MGGDEINLSEIDFLVDVLNKHPRESLRKIAELEGIDYSRLRRLYEKYYGPDKYVSVYSLFNMTRLGFKSYIAYLSVPKSEMNIVARRMLRNPFVATVHPTFGFKIGLKSILHIPKEQTIYIDDLLSRYSDDYEYYRVAPYPHVKMEPGEWDLSYDYARLIDIIKVDARTPVSEIARALGKSRATVNYMIKRLEELGILVGYAAIHDDKATDRVFNGIAYDLDEGLIEEWMEKYNMLVGQILPEGYYLEWYFNSKRVDVGEMIYKFGQYVQKFTIDYLAGFEWENRLDYFAKRVREDGGGYRSILEDF
ncbi:Lrp/AsnC family transcriptional regulator [Palaeococcus ferrophilus]|uniref:Lrp/AsnC family transcriptional regulator n=1 Tax=Palaeococcus ferrophilus TaxID=83868 RepID=UPI00064F41D4|nr:Lrp/AsnC family transcriptional regulator [Palaeococcus ferrophilus]